MEACRNLHVLLVDVARGRAGATALLAPGRPALSYAQLGGQVQNVGIRLACAGIGPRRRVAIALPNGAELGVATLAVASYATCTPLNPASSEAEFRAALEALRIDLLILPAAGAASARNAARALSIACIEAVWHSAMPAGLFELAGAAASSTPVQPAASDDVALLLQTSGTTSKPKRVPLTHANLCRSAANIAGTLRLRPEDRCLNAMPLFHVHGLVAGLLASLHAGASIACVPGLQPGHFAGWLRDFRPSWYTAVPTMHRTILDEIGRLPPGTLSHRLRFARSSSAPLSPTLAADLEAAFGVPVIEAYGMTEAAHQVASNPLPPAPRVAGSVGVGTGARIAIIDAAGAFLPARTTGEIAIRGDTVNTGYEAAAATNAVAFVDGWLRTGDQGWLDEQGYLHITGRLNELINRGGEKVSPREVEDALLEQPGVLECAAFAVAHPTLGEDVAAAVVVARDASVEGDALRRALFGRLSEAKIPSRVIVVDALPKGPTGKLQRIGMADRLREQLQTTFVAPRNDAEAEVAGWFADVLGLDRVGVTENFFAIGGDSLRGGQVLSRLRARFGVHLPLATLFRSPTPAELVAELARAGPSAGTERLLPLLAQVEALTEAEAQALLDRLPAAP